MRHFWLGASGIWLVCALALAEGGLERVASLVRTGDDQGALDAIAALSEETQDEDGLRYLKGRLLLATGRPCDAMEALAQTPSTLPEPMRADSLRQWARAAARCGRCEEARPILLGAASSEITVTRRDRAVAADCAVQMDEFEIAAEELARLTRRKGTLANRVALLALLSDVYVELGRTEDARNAALGAWKAAVQPGQQWVARRLEERAAPSAADRIGRAEELMDARRFDRAVRELESIDVADDAALNARWHHVYGMALFRMRTRYLDAARVLRQSALLGGPHEVEDAFHSARALSRADKDARAITAYRRFARHYPRSKRAPEARFLAAWLEIRLGRANGEKQMERLVRGKSQVHGRWRRAALWELGFRAFETRRYARAARYLSQYSKLTTTSMDVARGHYWLGRAYRRGPKAVEAYRNAIGVEPLHWYAVLAASRLKRLKITPPAPFEDPSSPGSTEVPERFLPLPETFEAYHRLGLDVEGIRWLSAHESSLVAPFPKPQRIPLLARLYRDAGAYREALRTARRRMAFIQSDPSEHRWWWDAAYPMPWLSIVDEHRGELPRALVYATMRQESGFQPEVVSRAGAVGLMQVMPELATKLSGRQMTRHALRDPETNIALGLKEMAALAEELDRVYPLSIAAYNAGKGRVRRWLAESGKMELDRFVERIPFNETRNYVRRVSTHYARYAYLDDPGSEWPRLPRFVNP
ncbi:MAG: lytic transglycosylase domain-containing protein [Myxococcales bacterium]|nr:MAG: lytic transglycosylase domain-containing protein [Myxococcales bacterium]